MENNQSLNDYQKTYTIRREDSQLVFLCKICGQSSRSPQDVNMRYCANCRLFHMQRLAHNLIGLRSYEKTG